MAIWKSLKRAERKAGELLAQLERNTRGNPQLSNVGQLQESEFTRVLQETNTTKQDASRWQAEAAIRRIIKTQGIV